VNRFLTILTLGCILSISVVAGEIPTSGSPAPAPNGTAGATTTTAPSDVPTVSEAEVLSSDALSALLSVLSFLAV
jgi:hypothetical protein